MYFATTICNGCIKLIPEESFSLSISLYKPFDSEMNITAIKAKISYYYKPKDVVGRKMEYIVYMAREFALWINRQRTTDQLPGSNIKMIYELETPEFVILREF